MSERTPSAGTWKRDVLLAAIWGLATWLVEVAVLPLPSMGIDRIRDWFAVAAMIFLQWFVSGMGMAFCVIWVERKFGSIRLILVALTLALAWGLFITLYVTPFVCRMGIWKSSGILFPGLPFPCEASSYEALGTWAYITWEMLLIAATFTPVYVLSARAERIRDLLAHAQIARQVSEKMFEQAQLQALQRRVDPAAFSHVMTVIQDRYGHDPEAADRLLDRLVSMLRTLMPGLRRDTSTLEAELSILRAYAELQDELHPGAAVWRIRFHGEASGELKFPPLLLQPTLETLWSRSLPRPAWSVTASHQGAVTRVVIQVHRATEPAAERALQHRLIPPLRSSWGSEAAVHIAISTEPPLTTLTLVSRVTAEPAASHSGVDPSSPIAETVLVQ